MKRFVGLFVAISLSVPLTFGQALAGVDAVSSTPGYRVEAVDLKRDGSGGLMLTLKLYNDLQKKADLGCEMRADRGEGCKQISGVYLIDGVNKKRYLVMRDADG